MPFSSKSGEPTSIKRLKKVICGENLNIITSLQFEQDLQAVLTQYPEIIQLVEIRFAELFQAIFDLLLTRSNLLLSEPLTYFPRLAHNINLYIDQTKSPVPVNSLMFCMIPCNPSHPDYDTNVTSIDEGRALLFEVLIHHGADVHAGDDAVIASLFYTSSQPKEMIQSALLLCDFGVNPLHLYKKSHPVLDSSPSSTQRTVMSAIEQPDSIKSTRRSSLAMLLSAGHRRTDDDDDEDNDDGRGGTAKRLIDLDDDSTSRSELYEPSRIRQSFHALAMRTGVGTRYLEQTAPRYARHQRNIYEKSSQGRYENNSTRHNNDDDDEEEEDDEDDSDRTPNGKKKSSHGSKISRLDSNIASKYASTTTASSKQHKIPTNHSNSPQQFSTKAYFESDYVTKQRHLAPLSKEALEMISVPEQPKICIDSKNYSHKSVAAVAASERYTHETDNTNAVNHNSPNLRYESLVRSCSATGGLADASWQLGEDAMASSIKQDVFYNSPSGYNTVLESPFYKLCQLYREDWSYYAKDCIFFIKAMLYNHISCINTEFENLSIEIQNTLYYSVLQLLSTPDGISIVYGLPHGVQWLGTMMKQQPESFETIMGLIIGSYITEPVSQVHDWVMQLIPVLPNSNLSIESSWKTIFIILFECIPQNYDQLGHFDENEGNYINLTLYTSFLQRICESLRHYYGLSTIQKYLSTPYENISLHLLSIDQLQSISSEPILGIFLTHMWASLYSWIDHIHIWQRFSPSSSSLYNNIDQLRDITTTTTPTTQQQLQSVTAMDKILAVYLGIVSIFELDLMSCVNPDVYLSIFTWLHATADNHTGYVIGLLYETMLYNYTIHCQHQYDSVQSTYQVQQQQQQEQQQQSQHAVLPPSSSDSHPCSSTSASPTVSPQLSRPVSTSQIHSSTQLAPFPNTMQEELAAAAAAAGVATVAASNPPASPSGSSFHANHSSSPSFALLAAKALSASYRCNPEMQGKTSPATPAVIAALQHP